MGGKQALEREEKITGYMKWKREKWEWGDRRMQKKTEHI